jgi:signal transduction protein with GAF and PtsI domain
MNKDAAKGNQFNSHPSGNVQKKGRDGETLHIDLRDQSLKLIVELAVATYNAAAASIALLDSTNNQLEFKAAHGEGHEKVVGKYIPIDTGIAGYVFVTGKSISIADVHHDPRFHHSFALGTGYIPQAILANPIIIEGEVVGVIEILDKVEAPDKGMNSSDLLGLFSKLASNVISTSRIYDLIREQNHVKAGRELAQLQDRINDLKLEQTLQASKVTHHNVKSDSPTDALQILAKYSEAELDLCVEILGNVGEYLKAVSSTSR